ncbi:hypothetical protein C7121_02655 [Paenibacillus glucanolyticus]|nr:hypothetical protein A3958_12850 [Paenibacillus glucanolyticus]AVV55125.1 hypothetical protein C7121_02655 [Paenibacillus glucanolyticus]ETT31052.1 hypothetical protein C169_25810 [Paenibacillus sp. FSL R5-808]OMF81600.1 hypothetical protein BK142_03750 [Paenibacillus glucanolyticus]
MQNTLKIVDFARKFEPDVYHRPQTQKNRLRDICPKNGLTIFSKWFILLVVNKMNMLVIFL